MDVRDFVKIKRIPGGSWEDSSIVKGAYISKTIFYKNFLELEEKTIFQERFSRTVSSGLVCLFHLIIQTSFWSRILFLMQERIGNNNSDNIT